VFSTSQFTDRFTPSPSLAKFPNSIVYPTPPLENTINDYISTATSPQNIPGRTISVPSPSTPPLTPDSDSILRDLSPPAFCHPLRRHDDEESAGDSKQSKDALDFLLNVFSRDGLDALPYARSVVISAPNMGATFDGVVLELPGKPKALYVDGKAAESVSLRESIVALLDLADECFQCSALIIALDRSCPVLGDILHSFMYVGGAVVTKPPFRVDPTYILVGMEI